MREVLLAILVIILGVLVYGPKFVGKDNDSQAKAFDVFVKLQYIILFVNIFVAIPVSFFIEFGKQDCAWDILKFSYWDKGFFIVSAILLVCTIFATKVNNDFVNKNLVNENTVHYADFYKFYEVLGRLAAIPVAASLIWYYIDLDFLFSPDGEKVSQCYEQVSEAPSTLLTVKNHSTPQITKSIPKSVQKKKTMFTDYMQDMSANIKANWHPPKANNSNKVVVLFKIARNGELLSAEIYSSSGSDELDKAALDAVYATAPFKPLPDEFKGNDVDVQFAFDYNVFNGKSKK